MNLPPCPQCESPYTYPDGNLIVCPECAHSWSAHEEFNVDPNEVRDAHGNLLQDGDDVVVIKDLKVKGASDPIKQGTRVKNIKLTPGEDHDISCRVDGFGAMELKSEFVKKN